MTNFSFLKHIAEYGDCEFMKKLNESSLGLELTTPSWIMVCSEKIEVRC